MDAMTISPKFQVAIPKKIRKALGLKPGQKVRVFAHEGRIEIVPVRPIEEARGFLKGIDTIMERETDREL